MSISSEYVIIDLKLIPWLGSCKERMNFDLLFFSICSIDSLTCLTKLENLTTLRLQDTVQNLSNPGNYCIYLLLRWYHETNITMWSSCNRKVGIFLAQACLCFCIHCVLFTGIIFSIIVIVAFSWQPEPGITLGTIGHWRVWRYACVTVRACHGTRVGWGAGWIWLCTAITY